MTRFEQEKMMAEKRAKSEQNIAQLEGMLRECRDLQAVIPNNTLEGSQEQRFIRERIAWLNDLLGDEKREYNSTFEAGEADVNDVVSKIH